VTATTTPKPSASSASTRPNWSDPRPTWHTVEDLKLATLDWVHWFGHTRLHSSIGYLPPVEYETEHNRQINTRWQPLPGEPSLH
jgi:transposase InsO family protein